MQTLVGQLNAPTHLTKALVHARDTLLIARPQYFCNVVCFNVEEGNSGMFDTIGILL